MHRLHKIAPYKLHLLLIAAVFHSRGKKRTWCYSNGESDYDKLRNGSYGMVLTALHGMQTWSILDSDENSVCLTNTRIITKTEEKNSPDFYTVQKII